MMESLTHEEFDLQVLQFAGDCTNRRRDIAHAFASVKDAASLLVDLSKVEHLDGAFLALLGQCKSRCANLAVLVADTGPGVRFLATQLFNVFRVYTDRAEAVYRLRRGEP
jgi:anti-anti-sigma regulatory factor